MIDLPVGDVDCLRATWHRDVMALLPYTLPVAMLTMAARMWVLALTDPKTRIVFSEVFCKTSRPETQH